MQYVKKVLVLKCTESSVFSNKSLHGLARIEIENGVAEFHLSLVNLHYSTNSEYFALVVDQNSNQFEFELGKRPSSCARLFLSLPVIDQGLSVGLFSIKDDIPLTLAFACEGKGVSLKEFKKIVADRCICKRKQSVKKECEENKGCSFSQSLFSAYDDEAVATENYYELDRQIQEKLSSLKECQHGNIQFENELFDNSSQEKTQEERALPDSFQDETSFYQCQENQRQRYFESVKKELDGLFFKFPQEQNLCRLFKDSKWAKIYYSTDKYYVVGLIFSNDKERYICYGVPAIYSNSPPKEFEGFCSFIPLSVFDMFGAGYWIMFQDADSGKCVHLN